MNRQIYISLMVLPMCFSHAWVNLVSGSNVSSFMTQTVSTTAVMTDSKNTQSQMISWQISARDEQTGDCLRQRKCKD
ncbi:hypothetical protein GNE08_08605 [Trichormus variabilis ARAD]|nr:MULTISPECIES: hypothetical protein [Nostocaceae]MBC1310826.1 hypothetical protein [Trichormus variabilis PNB]MBC1214284.1 hypothetical protein [Trichormus variabilis ARAD]MBC1257563.1 hypothetical protein [Trichormus variabilis V5]MBC1268332.1 hypothetical protein [Trichormus variabilis FSR]MBC1302788.1 hypothetical protein [Trichormus variabilis N2B]